MKSRAGFTLIELLVAVGIVAVMATATVFMINPPELLKRGRDSNRISDIASLDIALANYKSTIAGSMGATGTVYVSIPDPLATSTLGDQCQGLDLPSLPDGYNYGCAGSSTFRNIDGTGWIPLNLKSSAGVAAIASLPIDPINSTSSCSYYTYTTNGSNFELTANLESQKDRTLMQTDGGKYLGLYEKGSNLSLLPIDVAGGTIFVASYRGGSIGEFSGCTETYSKNVGSSGTGNGELESPTGDAVDGNGNLYVVDYNNDRVEKFDANGNYVSQFGTAGTSTGEFDHPDGIAVDASDSVYVVDQNNDRVEKFDANGNYVSQFGTAGTSTGEFSYPIGGIVVDSNGDSYVVDFYDYRVEKFDANGNYISQFGSYGTGDGQFISPDGIAVDASGNIYVGDANDDHIQKFDANGNYISQFGSSGTGNGQFDFNEGPGGIAIDERGNLYISDYGNNRIEKFNASGTYLTQFSLSSPYGITIQP